MKKEVQSKAIALSNEEIKDLEQKLEKKDNLIFKLEVEISKLKFS